MDIPRKLKPRNVKCLVCGQLVKSTWVKKKLPSKHIIAHTEWKKKCSTALCDLLNLKTQNDAYKHFFEVGSYCASCDEKLKNLEFSQRTLTKLKQLISDDIASLKLEMKLNSQRNKPKRLGSKSERKVLLEWPVERLKKEFGQSYTYSEVVHLINDGELKAIFKMRFLYIIES